MVERAHECISSAFGVGVVLFFVLLSFLFLGGSCGYVTRDESHGLEASLTRLAGKQRT